MLGHNRDFYAAVKDRGAEIEQAYLAGTPRSRELAARARTVFPGGSTRDSLLRKPYAPFIVEGNGAVVTDADGRQLVDFWLNATSQLLGHRHPAVLDAVAAQMKKGTAFYGPGSIEIDHALALLPRIEGAERVRYANSGSEAVMLAARLARGFTGRPLIAKFEGSYHGIYDDVSWSVAAPASRLGPAASPQPAAEGMGLLDPRGRALVLPFNDLDSASALIRQHADDLAAVIMEPLTNRIGFLPPDPEFLDGIVRLCSRLGIVLIADEVITFRTGRRGTMPLLGHRADLTTLGKVIGGGFPIGAVAGRAEIMDVSSPDAATRVQHAGTFNANPVSMAAGLATLQVMDEAAYERLTALGEHIRAGLRDIFAGLPIQVTGSSSIFKVTAMEGQIRDYRDAAGSDRSWEALVSLALINRGFLLTPQLQGCLSTETTRAQADGLLAAMSEIVARRH